MQILVLQRSGIWVGTKGKAFLCWEVAKDSLTRSLRTSSTGIWYGLAVHSHASAKVLRARHLQGFCPICVSLTASSKRHCRTAEQDRAVPPPAAVLVPAQLQKKSEVFRHQVCRQQNSYTTKFAAL